MIMETQDEVCLDGACWNRGDEVYCEHYYKFIARKDELLQKIEDIDNEDENLDMLQRAMEYFCGNYDICEGYKHALRLTIQDQFNNHECEIEDGDLDKLSDILDGAI